MGLPPWSESPSQWFVLVTGANGGLGMAICQRTINEFLTSPTRDPKSHLVLILSTRSELNSRRTVIALERFLRYTTEETTERGTAAKTLQKRAVAQGTEYDWKAEATRVHFLAFEVDLCKLKQIYEAAGRIKGLNGGLGSPDIVSRDGGKLWQGLKGIAIPRLDVLFMNAGIGGWTGIKYLQAIWKILTDMPDAVSQWDSWHFPNPAEIAAQGTVSKKSASDTTQELLNEEEEEEPKLGKIFCSNLFGHYLLAHELMPLLSGTEGREPGDRGRIIWMTSVEGTSEFMSLDDIQGLHSAHPYSSSKRVTDLLALTAHLPYLRQATAPYFALDDKPHTEEPNGEKPIQTDSSPPSRPDMYVVHPGVCNTSIANVNWFDAIFMVLTLYIARWMGSPWHPITPYRGAVAPAWAIVAPQAELDAEEEFDKDAGAAQAKAKWGSSADRWGREKVLKTEVGGWGWTGRVGDKGIEGGERYRVGRLRGAADLTQEDREKFEMEGRECWRQLEEMRIGWERRLGVSEGV